MLGAPVGASVGAVDGATDGATDGNAVGALLGDQDGALLGPYVVGALLGPYVSLGLVGANVLGAPVGASLGVSFHTNDSPASALTSGSSESANSFPKYSPRQSPSVPPARAATWQVDKSISSGRGA